MYAHLQMDRFASIQLLSSYTLLGWSIDALLPNSLPDCCSAKLTLVPMEETI